MHHLIVRDPRFNDLLLRNAVIVKQGVDTGKFPEDYATFVNNLFKELPLANLSQIIAMLERAVGEDRTVDVGSVLADLRSIAGDPNGSAMHAAIGCAGEGGELLDCVKKVFIYGKRWDQVDPKTDQTPVENLLEEMADFRFYYQKLLNMLGISDNDVLAMSYAKLGTRYASGKYSDAQAQQRADKAHEAPTHIGARTALPEPPPVRSFMGKPQPQPTPQRRKEDGQ